MVLYKIGMPATMHRYLFNFEQVFLLFGHCSPGLKWFYQNTHIHMHIVWLLYALENNILTKCLVPLKVFGLNWKFSLSFFLSLPWNVCVVSSSLFYGTQNTDLSFLFRAHPPHDLTFSLSHEYKSREHILLADWLAHNKTQKHCKQQQHQHTAYMQ